MEAWIFLSVMAAAFQTLRFMLQKKLSMGALSAGGATFARFAYSAPLVALSVAVYLPLTGAELPAFPARFWMFALSGGLAQILATWCVVALFAQRNFAVGITFKKTEVILTALAGLVILGDRISPPGFAAILVGLAGVMVLSDPPGGGQGIGRFFNRAAGLGLASGVFFALSAVAYRGATLEVASADPLLRAGLSLAVVTAAQATGMAIWLGWREPGQLAAVAGTWRTGLWVGMASMGGSIGWFTAFTLQNAAYVFAVGQIEVIFSIMASVLFFRETLQRRELWGIALLSSSIILLVMLG